MKIRLRSFAAISMDARVGKNSVEKSFHSTTNTLIMDLDKSVSPNLQVAPHNDPTDNGETQSQCLQSV